MIVARRRGIEAGTGARKTESRGLGLAIPTGVHWVQPETPAGTLLNVVLGLDDSRSDEEDQLLI